MLWAAAIAMDFAKVAGHQSLRKEPAHHAIIQITVLLRHKATTKMSLLITGWLVRDTLLMTSIMVTMVLKMRVLQVVYDDELDDENIPYKERVLKELHSRRTEEELYALLEEALEKLHSEQD